MKGLLDYLIQKSKNRVNPNSDRKKKRKDMNEKIEGDLTYKIIGCAMKVHNYLGNGFQEVIYQRALAIEFRKAGIEFARELEMPIIY